MAYTVFCLYLWVEGSSPGSTAGRRVREPGSAVAFLGTPRASCSGTLANYRCSKNTASSYVSHSERLSLLDCCGPIWATDGPDSLAVMPRNIATERRYIAFHLARAPRPDPACDCGGRVARRELWAEVRASRSQIVISL